MDSRAQVRVQLSARCNPHADGSLDRPEQAYAGLELDNHTLYTAATGDGPGRGGATGSGARPGPGSRGDTQYATIEPDRDLSSRGGGRATDYHEVPAAVTARAARPAGTNTAIDTALDNAPGPARCGHTASDGMSCRRAPATGSAHCRSHSCLAPGCVASKSSRTFFCLRHVHLGRPCVREPTAPAAETPYASPGADAVLYGSPAPKVSSGGLHSIRRNNLNRKPSQYDGFGASAASGAAEYAQPDSTNALVDDGQIEARLPARANDSVYGDAVEMSVVGGANQEGGHHYESMNYGDMDKRQTALEGISSA